MLFNPNYISGLVQADCTALVIWGSNLGLTLGLYLNNTVKAMVSLPPYHKNVLIGLLLSDGSFFVTVCFLKNTHSKNPKSKYGLRIRATFTITQNLDSIPVV
jgi:hypothetical protein